MSATIHEFKPRYCYCCAKRLRLDDKATQGKGKLQGYEWHESCQPLMDKELKCEAMAREIVNAACDELQKRLDAIYNQESNKP